MWIRLMKCYWKGIFLSLQRVNSLYINSPLHRQKHIYGGYILKSYTINLFSYSFCYFSYDYNVGDFDK